MAVECYINKIRYPLVGTVEITDHAAATSESTISVDIRGLPEPQAQDAVYLFDDDGSLLYGGICGIPTSPAWASIYTPATYELTVSGMNNLLTRRFVNKAWTNSSLYDIIREIYANIIKAENIALGTISPALAELPPQKYIAPDMTAYDVLNEIAGLVGGVWNIEVNPASTLRDYLGETSEPLRYYAGENGALPEITPFEFYDTPRFQPFRFTFLVRDDFPQISPPDTVREIQKSVESYKVRTVQTVKGATGVSDPQTETFVFDAEEGKVTTAWPVAELPTITVNGQAATVGVVGFDDDDTSKQWLFSNNSCEITLNDQYTPALVGGETIVVTYQGYFALRVRLENTQTIEDVAARSGTSGLIEDVEENDRYNTAAELISYASNRLYANAEAETSLSLTVNGLDGTTPFTIWNINWPELYISGEFVVVERTITIDTRKTIQVTLKDKGFLTAYGKTFLRDYANAPTDIRDTDVVIESHMTADNITLSQCITMRVPLVCYADDGQPWIWGCGGDYYYASN